MKKVRSYSRYSFDAAILLGKQIRLHRKQRNWTESELAQRAGVSRATLQKIEKGDMSCAIGLVFEIAALVGVTLFADNNSALNSIIAHIDDKIALLPKAIHTQAKKVDDDF
jgi:DNA-binding XRE family transcriptional regulator